MDLEILNSERFKQLCEELNKSVDKLSKNNHESEVDVHERDLRLSQYVKTNQELKRINSEKKIRTHEFDMESANSRERIKVLEDRISKTQENYSQLMAEVERNNWVLLKCREDGKEKENMARIIQNFIENFNQLTLKADSYVECVERKVSQQKSDYDSQVKCLQVEKEEMTGNIDRMSAKLGESLRENELLRYNLESAQESVEKLRTFISIPLASSMAGIKESLLLVDSSIERRLTEVRKKLNKLMCKYKLLLQTNGLLMARKMRFWLGSVVLPNRAEFLSLVEMIKSRVAEDHQHSLVVMKSMIESKERYCDQLAHLRERHLQLENELDEKARIICDLNDGVEESRVDTENYKKQVDQLLWSISMLEEECLAHKENLDAFREVHQTEANKRNLEMTDLETRLSDTRVQLQQSTETNRCLAEDLVRSRGEVDRLWHQRETLQDKVTELTQFLETERRGRRNKSKSLKSAQTKIEEKSKEITNMATTLSQTRTLLEEQISATSELAIKHDSDRAEIAAKIDEIRQLNERVDVQKVRIEEQSNEIQQMRGDEESRREELHDLDLVNKRLQQTLGDKSTELESVGNELEMCRRELQLRVTIIEEQKTKIQNSSEKEESVKRELENQMKQSEKLSSELEGGKRRMGVMEGEMDSLKEQLRLSSDTINRQRVEITWANEEVERMGRQLEMESEIKQNLMRSIESSTMEANSAQEELERSRRQIELRDERIDQQKGEIKEMAKTLQSIKQERDSAQSQLDSQGQQVLCLEDRLREEVDRIRELLSQQESSRKEAESLRHNLSDLEEKLNIERERSTKLSLLNRELRENMNTDQAEIFKAKERLSQTETELSETRRELRNLQNCNTTSQKKEESLREELTSTKCQLSRSLSDLSQAVKDREGLVGEVRELEDQFRKELSSLKSGMEEREKELTKLKEDYDSREEGNRGLNKSLKEKTNLLTQLRRENDEKREELSDLRRRSTEEVSNLMKELSSVKNQARLGDQRVQQLEAEITKIKKSSLREISDLSDSQTHLETKSNQRISLLTRELESLRDMVEKSKQENSDLQRINGELRDRVTKAVDDNESLTVKLNQKELTKGENARLLDGEKDKNEKLRVELSGCREELAECVKEIERMRSNEDRPTRVKRMAEELSNAVRLAEREKEEKEEARETVVRQRKENESLIAQNSKILSDFTTNIQQEQTKVKQLSSDLLQKERVIEKLQKQMDVLTKDLVAMKPTSTSTPLSKVSSKTAVRKQERIPPKVRSDIYSLDEEEEDEIFTFKRKRGNSKPPGKSFKIQPKKRYYL